MNIEKFIKDDLEIRVKVDNDKLTLNAKDLADVLGKKNTLGNTIDYYKFYDRMKNTYERLYENSLLFEGVNKNGTYEDILDSLYITESLFYYLVITSKTDKAKRFQLWVCEEVLPSLRKNSYYIDEENINKEQFKKLENDYLRMKEYFFNLCDMGKISLGRASELIFGNESELKKRLINLGWLDYEKCEFKQQKFKSSSGNIYELFVCNVSGIYKNGIVKHNLQVSVTNAGYVYLKDKFEKDIDLGVEREE